MGCESQETGIIIAVLLLKAALTKCRTRTWWLKTQKCIPPQFRKSEGHTPSQGSGQEFLPLGFWVNGIPCLVAL